MAKDDVARELKNINSAITNMHSELTAVKSDITGMKSDITGMKSDITGMKSDITGLRTDMSAGFTRVDAELNAAKIRDEEMLGKLTLGLEGLEGHRESTDAGFERMSREHREQTDLLKSVIVHVRKRVERVEARKPRRRS